MLCIILKCEGVNFARRTNCFKCDLEKGKNSVEIPQYQHDAHHHDSEHFEEGVQGPNNVLVIKGLPYDINEEEVRRVSCFAIVHLTLRNV